MQTKRERFKLDRRKTFFTVRVVKHCSRLTREAVDVSCLEIFQVRVARALSKLL